MHGITWLEGGAVVRGRGWGRGGLIKGKKIGSMVLHQWCKGGGRGRGWRASMDEKCGETSRADKRHRRVDSDGGANNINRV